jgi:hypothetical protein
MRIWQSFHGPPEPQSPRHNKLVCNRTNADANRQHNWTRKSYTAYNSSVEAVSVPPIYSIRHKPVPVGPTGRAVALLMSLGCLALLVTAGLLKPDPSGMGTHTALGLPPCSMPRIGASPAPPAE